MEWVALQSVYLMYRMRGRTGKPFSVIAVGIYKAGLRLPWLAWDKVDKLCDDAVDRLMLSGDAFVRLWVREGRRA